MIDTLIIVSTSVVLSLFLLWFGKVTGFDGWMRRIIRRAATDAYLGKKDGK